MQVIKHIRGEGIHPGFKTLGRHHQKSKTGYQWAHKKDICPPKYFLKSDDTLQQSIYLVIKAQE